MVFVDTWCWLTLGDKKEKRHSEIKDFFASLRGKGEIVFTSDYILDETYTLLFRRVNFSLAISSVDSIQKSINESFLKVERVNESRFKKALELRRKYSDKPFISFTDLTSMVIMSELGINEILTEDNHFLQVGMGFKKVPQN